MGIRVSETFNFYSHLAGGVAAVVGTVYLARIASHSAAMLITALVYGLSVVFLMTRTGFPREGASSWIPPESVRTR